MESSAGSYVTSDPILASEYVMTRGLVSMGSLISESAAAPALSRVPGATAEGMRASRGWRPFTARERKA
jgi:hypothetical protein